MRFVRRRPRSSVIDPGRRRFVLGLAASGVVSTLGLWRRPAQAADLASNTGSPAILYGSEFDLAISESPVNFTGRPRIATVVNGRVPAPLLRWREGDRVTLRVTNRLRVNSSIHWHGVLVPTGMDGVPGLSFPGIRPGETFVYSFDVRQNGTYWYHSHSALQEQTGLYGPLIIDPKQADPIQADRDYVVMLSDWTDEDPERVFSKLKMQSDYYNFHQPTVGDFFHDVKQEGWRKAIEERRMWGRARMSPRDIADVTGATYTYLMNGTTPAGNWTGLFKPGERVRLRFINGSSMTYFDIRIPGLKMTVIQADGQDVEPVPVDEFRIAVAETYDVIIEPDHVGAFTIFAQAMDRSGYARGTLTTHAGLIASVPPMDPRPVRTMMDMGMAMNQGGDMPGMRDSRDGQPGHPGPSMPGMDMSHDQTSGAMQDMSGMDMPANKQNQAFIPRESGATAGQATGRMKMDHSVSGAGDMNGMSMSPAPVARDRTRPVASLSGELAPNVDMHAVNPTDRLNDPGDGLENNGRRVLTYADLVARIPNTDMRAPDRELQIHLTGNMMRYIWSFDGRKYSQAKPIELAYNERVRIVLINDTMMEHPIHLHGMFVELDNGCGARRPRKHTVNVQPGERLSYLLTADARGRWAYHCHLLYHMMAGMFREVHVA